MFLFFKCSSKKQLCEILTIIRSTSHDVPAVDRCYEVYWALDQLYLMNTVLYYSGSVIRMKLLPISLLFLQETCIIKELIIIISLL